MGLTRRFYARSLVRVFSITDVLSNVLPSFFQLKAEYYRNQKHVRCRSYWNREREPVPNMSTEPKLLITSSQTCKRISLFLHTCRKKLNRLSHICFFNTHLFIHKRKLTLRKGIFFHPYPLLPGCISEILLDSWHCKLQPLLWSGQKRNMQKSQYILCEIIAVGLKCRHNCFILNISFHDVSLLANPLHFCGFKTWWNLLIRNEFPFALPSNH